MTFKDFCLGLTEAQKQNWRDYREAEKLKPQNSNIETWHIVDILRLRRKGEDYKSIVMITGLSEWTVNRICRAAGLGREWITNFKKGKC
jgi:uncharacterized protein YerC